MARPYRLTPLRRIGNVLVRGAVRLGLGDRSVHLLTVRGRRTGRPYSTPVHLVEDGAERWLVAPYGERQWVQNARAAGHVELSRRGRRERLAIAEATPAQAAPVLREYVRRVSITRPYFDAGPDDPVEAFEREAGSHPVFRLVPPEHRQPGR